MAPPRIVSLLPSTTEIACALGFQEHLVGRSHECDFPPGVERLPACTEPKFDTEGSSSEIDSRVRAVVRSRVRAVVRDGLSVYRVNAELLRSLAPDVILTQSQCEVCAASLADVEAAVGEWIGSAASRPLVVSLAPATLADVLEDVLRVADALSAPERGGALVVELESRIAAIAERSAAGERPTVACVEWLDPLMAAGNWMPEVVARAGGQSLFGEVGKHSPWLDWEALRRADPDVIVALPCGFDLARTRRETASLATRPEWLALRAVRDGRVYLTDGNAYFNRPGPRIVESIEILAEILHPDLFGSGHETLAWERAGTFLQVPLSVPER